MRRFVIEHEKEYFKIETDIAGVLEYFEENYGVMIPSEIITALTTVYLFNGIGLIVKIRGYNVYSNTEK